MNNIERIDLCDLKFYEPFAILPKYGKLEAGAILVYPPDFDKRRVDKLRESFGSINKNIDPNTLFELFMDFVALKFKIEFVLGRYIKIIELRTPVADEDETEEFYQKYEPYWVSGNEPL